MDTTRISGLKYMKTSTEKQDMFKYNVHIQRVQEGSREGYILGGPDWAHGRIISGTMIWDIT